MIPRDLIVRSQKENGCYVTSLEQALSVTVLESASFPACLLNGMINSMREDLGDPPLDMVTTRLWVDAGLLVVQMEVSL